MIELTSYGGYDCAIKTIWALVLFEMLIVWPVVILLVIHLLLGTSFLNLTGLASLIAIDVLNITLVYSSNGAVIFFRRLLLHSLLEYIGLFLSQWESLVLIEDTCPLFYVDIQGYSSLTEYFDRHLEKAKLCKDDGPDERARFKFVKKSRRNVLKSVPNTMKKLVENDRLEIRTRSCMHLTREHFQILWNHEVEVDDDDDSWSIEGLNQCFQLATFMGVMDEFWINGKLVAFQTYCLIGETMVDGMWAVLPEARQLGLYFIGTRLVLKRAIADPSVKYVNLNVMDLDKENFCLPKRKFFAQEIGRPGEDRCLVAALYGFPDLVISFENLGKWIKAFGSIRFGEEFWEVKDESDLC